MLIILRAVAGLAVLAGLLILFPVWFPKPATTSPLSPVGQSRAGEPYLSGWADERLRRREGEDDLTFATRITRQVNLSTYHCEAAETAQGWAAQLAAARAPETRTYGYLDPSILRCGFCHQRAFILAEAMRRGGIADAQTYALNGHVATLFHVGALTYLADADYGVEPFIYDGNTYAAVPQTEYAPHVHHTALPTLQQAYATPTDDEPYMTHEWLMTLAVRQADEVRLIERRLNLLGDGLLALGALLAFASLLLPRRSVTASLAP